MKAMKRQQLTRMLEDRTKFQISDEARAAHLNAIAEAIESAPVVVPATRTRWSTSLRRRITGLLIATMTLGPAGVAFAAQGSLPGDSLYPAKRVVERVQAVFDPLVPARHRLEEVSGLMARGDDPSEIVRALQEAAVAVAAAPDGSALSGELETLKQEVEPNSTGLVEEEVEGPAGSSIEGFGEGGVESSDGSDAEQVEGSQDGIAEVSDGSDAEQVEGSDDAESGSSASVSAPEEDETTVSEPTEPEEPTDVGSGENTDDEASEAGASSDADEPEHP
ncbi:MAG: hypothetical protein GXP34_09655 [Actinobacteria bacterium]|nr:hypothetical protein [Actinomycetota bacterium]